MKKPRIAIVGLGFGAEFIPIYQRHPDAEMAAICQRDPKKLDAIGDAFGIAKRFTDFKDVLKDPDIDAVHINSPIPDHGWMSIAALKAGKHVSCTVPMATSIEECKQIVALVKKTGLKYTMAETVVYAREYLFMKELLDSGKLGKLQFVQASHQQDMDGWPNYWPGLPPMWYATHCVGPVSGLVGASAEYVSCFGSGTIRPELAKKYGSPFAVETAHIKYAGSDVSARIIRSLFDTARQYRESIDVYGSKASVEWPLIEHEPLVMHTAKLPEPKIPKTVKTPDFAKRLPKAIQPFTTKGVYDLGKKTHLSFVQGAGHGGSHPHLVHEFVSSLVEDRDPFPNARQSANWTCVGLCAHESALAGGKIVKLPGFTILGPARRFAGGPMSSEQQPRVALLIETSNAYARGLLRGIEDYIRSHGPWSVYLAEHGRGDRPPSWLAKWKGDGIIARIENRTIASALEPLRLPMVDVSAARLVPRLPWVETDDDAIAELAAQHLLERGFRTFGFCGERRFQWSNTREERFATITRERGHACYIYTSAGKHEDGDAEIDDIARWLVKLPKPAAVFACYDARGQQVLDAARRAGLAVPEELAVLGVDNDEVLCSLSPPPLSSIIPNVQRTGWEAAAVLDSMMKGRRLEGDAHLIPPIGVATRQSTDVLAVDDPQMARALRYIREHACDGLGVDDVVRHCAITRRVLETKMKTLLNRTPREEIARVQTARVQELLAATDLTLAEIADRAGFRHVEYLSVFFKRETGTPPSQWRAEHQPKWRRSGSPD